MPRFIIRYTELHKEELLQPLSSGLERHTCEAPWFVILIILFGNHALSWLVTRYEIGYYNATFPPPPSTNANYYTFTWMQVLDYIDYVWGAW